MKAILHDLNAPGAQVFDTLQAALTKASQDRATGYVITPTHDVIDLKNGKRKSADGKRFVNRVH